MNGECQCGCGLPAPVAKQTTTRLGYVNGQAMQFLHGHNHRGKRGAETANFRHGASATPAYKSYRAARERCTRVNGQDWARYGGRGIKFLFASFEDFLAHLGPRPAGRTLDRIDNDGHYAPGNVRWTTRKEQRRNQSLSANSDESLIAECKRRNLWPAREGDVG